ncbi:unnamed protein product [Psylliodes chrysocephalus]|uniref:Uncharacterized protein n=1 Tax=Psylliodes chrysocephalus TaxID=3402493 RepID=A0A9P0CIC8_9CUCU|nr:unnamed protein product [Psylliodes chrysocephala]
MLITFGTVLAIFIIGVLLIKQSEKEKQKKIMNVYSQKGRWYRLKFCFIALILFLRRIKYYFLGKSHVHKEEELEKLLELSNHPEAFDAVFFQAVSQNGVYICTGTERRHNAKLAAVVYVIHPDYGVLESESLPKTAIDADVSSLYKKDSYSGGGICFVPVVPMKKWKVSFNGLMKFQNDPKKFIKVKFECDWTSNHDWFFFEVDVPIRTIARAFAREPWSKRFFKNVKDAHQSHYEQMGVMNGTLQIDGKTTSLVDVDSFRDHSFGFKRDWSLMHRYIYCMLYLSDHTVISMGVVSHPSITTHLEMGFVNHPDRPFDAIESIDLRLYEHAENGKMPKELNYTFKAGGKLYDVKLKFIHDAKHYKGSNEEAIMNERFLECEVNGIPGRGISEWHYNKNMFE